MKLRWKLLSLTALLGTNLLVGNVAAAQDEIAESRVPTRFEPKTFKGGEVARQKISEFGRCVAENKNDEVTVFLTNPAPSTWEPILDFPNDLTPCAPLSIKGDFVDFRGALAEGWYLTQFEQEPPAFIVDGEHTPPSQKETVALIVAAAEEDKAQVIIDEFARCVATVDPRAVDALLRTKHATSEESAAIQALAHSFAPCAFEGQKLAFDQAGLRSALAYAMARRAVLEEPA